MGDEQPDAPRVGDAFGQILARCWAAGARPGAAFDVVERDDGFIGVQDAAAYFDGPDQWPSVDRDLLATVAGRVLDVGCGAGRHAVAVREGGARVVGLEPSPGAAAVARARGLDVVRASVYDPPAGLGVFDEILMLGNNLGLLADARTAVRVLSTLATLAAPGARVIADNLDPYLTTNPAHLAYHERNRARGRMAGQIRMRVRDGITASEFFDYLFVSPDELTALLAASPWRLDRLHQRDVGYVVELRLR